MTADESGGRLARWSRRKREARTAAAAPSADIEAQALPDDTLPAEPELTEAEFLEARGLKDPDEMAAGDDFSAFMEGAVPAALKRRALRRLWRLNPALANLDELLEYGEDYTDAAVVPQVVATAYRVGRGFLRDEAEDTDPDEPRGSIAALSEEDDDAPDAPRSVAVTEGEGAGSSLEEAQHERLESQKMSMPVARDAEQLEASAEPATRRPPRMRFKPT